ncbi:MULTISPECIES: class I SAM-dependent methyltransferase [unclassified Spirosoma]|uniref:O-methyltransferase n=1 Tax=unclassified Spirosoma TaxID=2621999 RepID=UPI000967EC17|nr:MULTISPECIES: class I SAM-dependent methyltransferase [unclassified Spirosoma]MBN8826196.1 class I SAM-dependent methyltransferase [Spirosoma sp.]OJW76908.1 MAG: methyltransferase [Spirosoma sp. 48-14]
MDQTLHKFLEELAKFGKTNDQQVTQRSERMLNITPDTGPFLSILIKSTKAKDVLEIGTSNGYSTIWLADAVRSTGGHITTIEMNPWKVDQARLNFQQASVDEFITQIVTPAENYLPTCSSNSIDVIFLDSERSQYAGWLNQLLRLLRPGGLLVVDNAVSHEAELTEFMSLVQQTPDLDTSLVPIGNGELLIWKCI